MLFVKDGGLQGYASSAHACDTSLPRRRMFGVIRSLAQLGFVFLLAGCSGSGKPDAAPSPPSSSPPASSALPKAPRPNIAGVPDGPPPAWLETERGSFWLGYSSYCWGRACVDFIPPACNDPKHTPRIVLRRGEHVTAHLPFTPTELGLALMRPRGSSATKQRKLRLSSEPSWVIRQPGPFSLFARAKPGDASYVACVVLRD
jgi:hypothetical protein